ncbi:hypothetical protein [Amycolatopsis kentuckyensis]|uniref:hypothetical protein n=1 Tax=Amycolatopsis kentuckyensis TaxID=218823 RepID=UPI00356AF5D8
MLPDLTDLERELVDAARRGTTLKCSDLDLDQLHGTDAPEYCLRGQVVRELLLGHHGELDPRGVWVEGARIIGEIDLRYAEAKVGLCLHRCLVDGSTRFRGAHLPWLYLVGTRVGGFSANGLHLDGDLLLRDGFTCSGVDPLGAVRLLSARIGGNLELDGARLSHQTGPALAAELLRVDGSLFLRDGFTAIGAGDSGAVRLLGAHVGGVLDLGGAQVTNATGPALHAERVRVEASLYMRNGFAGTGAGSLGAVRLSGASIGGQLSLRGAQLINTGTGPVLDLQGMKCTDAVLMAHLICPEGRSTGRSCRHAARQVRVDRFVFNDFAGMDWRQLLHLLRCHTENYSPLPYQQLAASLTATGHDRNVREVLIIQQQDHRVRGDFGNRLRRAVHAIWGGLAGYGYRTGRTAAALLIVVTLAAGLGLWAGHTATGPGRYAAERPGGLGACSSVELVGLGIDRGLPLASTGIRARCDLDTASLAGQRFTVVVWLLQAALWALATLVLAGYTSLVRKTR